VVQHVKGAFFADYVRMLRSRSAVDHSAFLEPEDKGYLSEQIDPMEWYPMRTFERMGLAILEILAEGDLSRVRLFGRQSVRWVADAYPGLVVDNDPRETLMRVQVLRRTFFDFPAVEMPSISDGEARLEINFKLGRLAEKAAVHQTMGFFEGLLDRAGGQNVHAVLQHEAWEGSPATVILLAWE